jgi:hypothetical protein
MQKGQKRHKGGKRCKYWIITKAGENKSSFLEEGGVSDQFITPGKTGGENNICNCIWFFLISLFLYFLLHCDSFVTLSPLYTELLVPSTSCKKNTSCKKTLPASV